VASWNLGADTTNRGLEKHLQPSSLHGVLEPVMVQLLLQEILA